MKVYDCTTFSGENSVLEIRLNELDSVVDKFIIVEARKTHSGRDKPLYFEQCEARYDRFIHKIHYIVLDSFPSTDPWFCENYQRNAIMRGLETVQDDDLVMISDLDEIPRASLVKSLIPELCPLVFEQRHSMIYLNRITQKPEDGQWCGTSVVTGEYLKTHSPQNIRDSKNGFIKIKNGGHHYCYVGGIERVLTKIKSLCHTEYAHLADDKEKILEHIKNNTDILGRSGGLTKRIEIDDSFPQYVRDNQERFKHLIEFNPV